MKNSILVIDDEKNIRLTIARALERSNYLIETAVNAEEALSKLNQTKFNLILLDIKLPGTSGMDILRIIREKNHRIQIIIITAYGTVDDAVEAMKLGAVDFIQKPFTPEEIRIIVQKALERKQGFFIKYSTTMINYSQSGNESTTVDNELKDKIDISASTKYDYDYCIQQAKTAIENRIFDEAIPWIEQAISSNMARPESYNILGVIMEIQHKPLQAQKYYRAALALDPTYKPAANNLNRVVGIKQNRIVDIGK